ncbi:hypothetical protein COCON_G00219910 [Conger conger]|uniref:Uncharacterized protein n=1 Tax=Conger conger TaxID=82655 RepID=A0A9Q1HNZ1_CONCO|nr:hypothetical protein COCON_G00219910 [Conger conger]
MGKISSCYTLATGLRKHPSAIGERRAAASLRRPPPLPREARRHMVLSLCEHGVMPPSGSPPPRARNPRPISVQIEPRHWLRSPARPSHASRVNSVFPRAFQNLPGADSNKPSMLLCRPVKRDFYTRYGHLSELPPHCVTGGSSQENVEFLAPGVGRVARSLRGALRWRWLAARERGANCLLTSEVRCVMPDLAGDCGAYMVSLGASE